MFLIENKFYSIHLKEASIQSLIVSILTAAILAYIETYSVCHMTVIKETRLLKWLSLVLMLYQGSDPR